MPQPYAGTCASVAEEAVVAEDDEVAGSVRPVLSIRQPFARLQRDSQEFEAGN